MKHYFFRIAFFLCYCATGKISVENLRRSFKQWYLDRNNQAIGDQKTIAIIFIKKLQKLQ